MKKSSFLAVAVLFSVALLMACKPATHGVSNEMVRPVKTITVGSDSSVPSQRFSAEIRPRIDSQLAFRVSGKITERLVEMGQVVKKGQVLLRLDPVDLELASQAAAAQLASAKANADVADAALKRSQDLARQNFISSGALDQAVGQSKAANAALKAAEANAALGVNATQYGLLKADNDGVVTALMAEVGQIVSAGTPVLRVAVGREKDVVFSVPESQLGAVKRGTNLTVQLWSEPGQMFKATVRDVASIADAQSRSFSVKAQLLDAPVSVPLGATATVSLSPSNPKTASANQAPSIAIPLSAVIEVQGQPAVWVVEGGAVKKQSVTLGALPSSNGLIGVTSGLSMGAVVVVAGTHVLTPGQKVKAMQDTAAPVSAKP